MAHSGKPYIAIFVPTLGGGGAEMNALRLANEWASGGARIVFLVRRRGGSYESQLHPGIEVVELLRRPVRSSALGLLLCIRPLYRWLKRYDPEILLSVMTAPSVYAALAVRLAGRGTKQIASVQNSIVAEYRGSVDWFRKFEFFLARKTLPKIRGVIALSAGVQKEVVDVLGVPEKSVRMVHNCGERTDEAAIQVPVDVSRERKFVVVACGRLVKQKNYPLLLRAFSRLRNLKDADLWVLGEGPLRAELGRMAADLGISAHVRFLGFRTPSSAYMKLGDVFVLSSSWEGFANVIVEAMGAGVPVIATDCNHGPREIICDGRFGILVPVDDESSLASAIDFLLENDGERARLAAAGRLRAADFQPNLIARKFMKEMLEIAHQ